MGEVPTTVAFPRPLPARRTGRDRWEIEVDGVTVRLSNLGKVFWNPEGYTKADLVAYYYNIAPVILPYLRDRPLTLKRMPDGADGEFFYAKRAPSYTPAWMQTVPVTSIEDGTTITYLLAQDTASLLWLANLGCIEMHAWHGRRDALGHPDYAFFDLDPFGVGFDTVLHVASLVRTALDRLGVRAYARTSGATGIQIYVPLDRVHTADRVREWVGLVCRVINRADPATTTMEWDVSKRTGTVFLDHNMNTEGRNIATAFSLRPERQAPVATPLTWDEVESGVRPTDFTIATVWPQAQRRAQAFAPVLAGGQDLREAMRALGMQPDAPSSPKHVAGDNRAAEDPGDLGDYARKRDFAKTSEPSAQPGRRLRPSPPAEPDSTTAAAAAGEGRRFVIQHHLATRLHHDLRLERGGTARSWAVPKGLPDTPGVRHLAVQTEDHPLEYLTFTGEIPEGEYGAGPVRIWDSGTYEPVEWEPGKVTFRLDGRRHRGEWHLFRTGGPDARNQWMITRAGEPEPLPADPPRLQPMLAATVPEPFDGQGWVFEVKWDGIRAVATAVRPRGGQDGRTTLISRAGNDITAGYPELADLWQRVIARNAVLDGEIVTLGPDGVPSFERLQRRMHLREAGAVEQARRELPVTYMVFDLLAVDGETLVDRPLSERVERLDEVLVPGRSVTRSVSVATNGCDLYEAVAARGMEGIVAKRLDAPYRPGRRTQDWRKVKVRQRLNCVIGGWLPEHAGRPGRGGPGAPLGSLLVGLWAGDRLAYLGRVGTGFDAAERGRLETLLRKRPAEDSPFADDPPGPARWVTPDVVCTVEYVERTAGGHLRAPSYKGLRPDVDARDCTEDLG